jgi:hypothetical protein
MSISILLAEDYQIVREATRAITTRFPKIKVLILSAKYPYQDVYKKCLL